MCLAIVKPASAVVPEDALRAGWISNSDGGGFAFVSNGEVVIANGYMKLKDFYAAYNSAVEANPDSPFLLHFRICSMGDVSKDNTHPFPIEGGALIHNGTLSGTAARYSTGPSDTKYFVEMFKKDLSFDVIQDNKGKWDAAMGHNKLAMLYNDGRYQIVNEGLGVWEGGVWYSNHSFRTRSYSAFQDQINWE